MRVLATARLFLRAAEAGDAPFYLQLLNDPTFIANLGDRAIRTLAQARAALADGPIAMQAALGHSLYLVERHDGVAIGMCGLIKRETLAGVDLGYGFLEAWRGQGYAREAAGAVLEYAHRQLGLRRVLAIASPQNVKSISLLQNIGFSFVRIVHLSPDDGGTCLYAHEQGAGGAGNATMES